MTDLARETFSLRSGAVVVCTFSGSGEIWRKGMHHHAGRVLKPGPSGGWMVEVFRPIEERDRMTDEWRESHVVTCLGTEITVIGR